MRRGTTPTITFAFEGMTFEHCKLDATLSQGDTLIVFENPEVTVDGDDCTVNLRLTQEDTLSLQNGRATIQFRWVDELGNADASDKYPIVIKDVQHDGVITYEDKE